MLIQIQDIDTNNKLDVTIADQLAEGSNSKVFDVVVGNSKGKFVAKCSKNEKNYVSFNLQRNAFIECEVLRKYEIIVPAIAGYGTALNVGDVLVLEKIENLYDISFIINNGFYYGEIIIRKVAEAIARLHNIGISGYDVEFYWKADVNKLVLLDIGPQHTFECTAEEMIVEHLKIEKFNYMGLWNIVSQLLPIEEAKKFYKKEVLLTEAEIKKYIAQNSIEQHITNVAKVHALTIIARLSPTKQKYYLDIFINEYKKNRDNLSIDSALYIKSFKKAIINKDKYAKACLYYSIADTLCQESCAVELKGE